MEHAEILVFVTYVTVRSLELFQAETQSDYVHAATASGIGISFPENALSRRFPQRGSRTSDIALGSTCSGESFLQSFSCFIDITYSLSTGSFVFLQKKLLLIITQTFPNIKITLPNFVTIVQLINKALC